MLTGKEAVAWRELALIDASGAEHLLGDEPLGVDVDGFVQDAYDREKALLCIRDGFIEAIGSCLVGGIPLAPGKSRRLIGACSVRLGDAKLRVDVRTNSPQRDPSTRSLALKIVTLGLDPVVEAVEGPANGARLELREERSYTVGRSSRCDLVLADEGVSREQAVIILRQGRVLIRDLAASGGTRLGVNRLEPHQEAFWPADYMLAIGRTVLALRLPTGIRRALDAADAVPDVPNISAPDPPNAIGSSAAVDIPTTLKSDAGDLPHATPPSQVGDRANAPPSPASLPTGIAAPIAPAVSPGRQPPRGRARYDVRYLLGIVGAAAVAVLLVIGVVYVLMSG